MSLTALNEAIVDAFSSFDDELEPIVSLSEPITVPANTWVTDREIITINGVDMAFNTQFMFIDPILSSISHRTTNATNSETNEVYENRKDFSAVVVAGRAVKVEVNPGEWQSLEDFALHLIRTANPNATSSDADILAVLKGYGWDQRGRHPMYLQHLGADPDLFAEVTHQFEALGAKENTASVKTTGQLSHVQSSWRHSSGPDIASLEISKADRSRSRNGTGFVGFFEAAFGTFGYALAFHRERSALTKLKQAEETQVAATARDIEILRMFQNPSTRSAFRNWGGTNRVVNVIDDTVNWWAQQVPCGRFDVVVGRNADGPEVATWSVWGTSRRNAAATGVASSDVTGEAVPNGVF